MPAIRIDKTAHLCERRCPQTRADLSRDTEVPPLCSRSPIQHQHQQGRHFSTHPLMLPALHEHQAFPWASWRSTYREEVQKITPAHLHRKAQAVECTCRCPPTLMTASVRLQRQQASWLAWTQCASSGTQTPATANLTSHISNKAVISFYIFACSPGYMHAVAELLGASRHSIMMRLAHHG